jgi:hypothetical protein
MYLFQESVDRMGVPGFDRVEALATSLLALRTQHRHLSLTNAKAEQIIQLWDNLLDYDKKPVLWKERHLTGLHPVFFHTKKTVTVPGVQSTEK